MPMVPNARPMRGGRRETKFEMYRVKLYLKDNFLKKYYTTQRKKRWQRFSHIKNNF